MTLRSLLIAAFLFSAVASMSLRLACGQTPGPASSIPAVTPPQAGSASPGLPQSPPPSPASATAPYEQRLATAESVKVMMSILGLELGSTIEQAHANLDQLSDPAHPPKEEKEGSEKGEAPQHKVLWQLGQTDYSFVFVKTDDEERINYIKAFLRPGKEIPFEKIGETEKAPVQDATTIAWDVLRPKRPLFRVVATGAERKANSIMIFVVRRSGEHGKERD